MNLLAPPNQGAFSRLNVHLMWASEKYRVTDSCAMSFTRALCAALNVFLLTECTQFGNPLLAPNLLKKCRNASVDMFGTTNSSGHAACVQANPDLVTILDVKAPTVRMQSGMTLSMS